VKLKAVLIAGLALLALAGAAKASGVLDKDHKDAGYDVVEARTTQLERALEKRAAQGDEGLTASARAATRGPRGPRGARGPKGAKGANGPAGVPGTFGSISVVSSPSIFLCSFFSGACAVGSVQAVCPPGTTLVGGGYTGAGIVTTVTWSAPVANAWGIIAVNLDEVPVSNLKAVAECATH
jgi:hypothetical protein